MVQNKKRKLKIIFLTLIFAVTLNLFSDFKITYASQNTVYVGGMSAGFILDTRGAKVVGFTEVITANGKKQPAKDGGIEVNDRILFIDGYVINNAKDIESAIKTEKIVKIVVERGNNEKTLYVTPAKELSGSYRLGLLIKNNITGIGTITYINSNNRFGALGHSVSTRGGEPDTILGGNIYCCPITGITRGEKGRAGELKGSILQNFVLGNIDKNLSTGVYGYVNKKFNFNGLTKAEIASDNEINVGKAEIYCTLNGKDINKYEIEIVKTSLNASDNKNYVIKVTDKNLIDIAGGIVQGMSGSPILQNGKLIGAVTHVFLNDPTRGYGIAIKNMIVN